MTVAAPAPKFRRSGSIITVLVALAVLAGSVWLSNAGRSAQPASEAAIVVSPAAAEIGHYEDYPLRHAPVVAEPLDLRDDFATRHMPAAPAEADRQDYGRRYVVR